ncbi:NYN domain-containing protein, partial [Bacillus pumilus]|uniref:NYN domain-containing protein n=1 Tax=Bacillus pumilus TaxID=1408 RepID=UPI0021B40F6C
MIGGWGRLEQLKENRFEEGREIVIENLGEYEGYRGYGVIVVLDGDMVKGMEKKGMNEGVEVMFRRENERGDEGIEKL